MFRHAVATLWLFLFGPMNGQASDSIKAIVFPLENATSSESLKWLSEGIALCLSEQIACRWVKPVSRIERIGIIESLDLPPSALLSRASMIRVAQEAGADWVVFGSYKGREHNLSVTVRVLNVKTLKLSGAMTANGSLSAMPQIENELSWLILKNNGFEKSFSRANFARRMRTVPNEAYSLFVKSLEQLNEKEKLRLLLKAVEIYPSFPSAQIEIGRYYFQRGDCKQALNHLPLVHGDNGSAPENSHMRGTCYLYLNMLDQAIETFSQIDDAFKSYETFNNLGVAYLRKGEISLALANFIEAGNRARSDSTVILNQAIGLHIQGNSQKALILLEQALKTHPRYGMMQFVFGFILNSVGQRDKSLAAIEKARSLGVHVDKLQREDSRQWAKIMGPVK